jgi:hypothetical protein
MTSDSRASLCDAADENSSKTARRSWAPEQSPLPPSPRRANHYFRPLTKATAERIRAEARERPTIGDLSDEDSEGEDAGTSTRAEADTPQRPNSEDCADHAAPNSGEDRDVNALARQLKYIAFDFASSESKPSGWKPTVRTPTGRAGTFPRTNLDFR